MRLVILPLIILLAVGAGFFVLQLAEKPEQPKAAETAEIPLSTVNVLVARQPIPMGTVLDAEMLDQFVDKQPWPQHLVLDGFIIADSPEAIGGMVARSDFQAQEPLSRYKLANPNDANFLAAALPAGKRAITVSVDTISGVAGYVFPGDRIDIIMAHNVPDQLSGNQGAGGRAKYTEILVPDVRVMAVDVRNSQQYQQQLAQQGQIPPPQAPTSVTLEVSVEDVQKIRLAEKNATLSLSLRPIKGGETMEGVSSTQLSDITNVQTGSIKRTSGQVLIVRGVTAEPVPVQQPGQAGGAMNSSEMINY